MNVSISAYQWLLTQLQQHSIPDHLYGTSLTVT